MEAIAAALTTTTAPVELLEYIDARRVEELAASILGKHVPISILLLYTVLIPRRMRDTLVRGRIYTPSSSGVLPARRLQRNENINSQFPTSVQALLNELNAGQQDCS